MDIADDLTDIVEIHADVRNFFQCPINVRRTSADIWSAEPLQIFEISMCNLSIRIKKSLT